MTAELTAEEIVTNLLSSHEIIKPMKLHLELTTKANLGEYLDTLPKEEERCNVDDSYTEQDKVKEKRSRFSFIKNKWEI